MRVMPNCMFGQITKEFKEFFYVNCKVEDLHNLELVPKLKLALLMQAKYAYFLRDGNLLLSKYLSIFDLLLSNL